VVKFKLLALCNFQIKVLNDSKEIAATLYLSSGILAVVIIISLAIPTYLNVYGACYAIGIPTASTVVLLVVFVSKVGYVPRNLGICTILRLHYAFSESGKCVPVLRLRYCAMRSQNLENACQSRDYAAHSQNLENAC